MTKISEKFETACVCLLWLVAMPFMLTVLVLLWKRDGYSWRESFRKAWQGADV